MPSTMARWSAATLEVILRRTNVKYTLTFMATSIDTLYRLAEPSAGYFTTAQAATQGVSRQQLSYLANTGSIDRVAHGIYRLRRFPSQRFEDVIVACMWVGPDAAASHDTAAAIYELTDVMPNRIHVTVSQPFRGRWNGVVVHVASLANEEVTERAGIPVTTMVRTIHDIAHRSGPDAARELAHEALARGLATRSNLPMGLMEAGEVEAVLETTAVLP